MTAIPQIRRLVAEDFPQQKSWIRPMFQILNLFMESIVTSINRKLTIRGNMAADMQSVTLYSAPSAANPFPLQWQLTETPASILIGGISGVTISAAVSLQWSYDNKGLNITNLIGVTPTNTAPITLQLVIFTG